MRKLEVNITERFYEIGNEIFNVQGVNYINNCELAYESNDNIAINKVFYTTENSIQNFMDVVVAFLISTYNLLINKKKEGEEALLNLKKQSFAINNNNTSNAVIRNNVRNRLLKTINQDVDTYRLEKSTVHKPKPKYKNQLKTANDKVVHKEGYSVKNDFTQLLISVRKKFMNIIFKQY